MSWFWNAFYLLAAALVAGGTAVAKGSEQFFTHSKKLEEELLKKIEVTTNNNGLSDKLKDLLKAVADKGESLSKELMNKVKTTET